MCKLREARDCKRVTKVVVVTDNPGPLAPGKQILPFVLIIVFNEPFESGFPLI